MDPSDARRPPADPLDAAAYWFARDSGGLMSAAERSEFDAFGAAPIPRMNAPTAKCWTPGR